MADLDIHARQDEPYHGEFEWLDDADVPLPLPATGDLRMHVRSEIPSRRLFLDASPHLSRSGATKLVLDFPPEVTITFPEELFYDVWIGDTQISEGRLLTDPSVTRRVYA